MTDDELQERIDTAHDRWCSLHGFTPERSSWGFYSYGDAPPAIGGGFGTFVWFADRSTMLDFIAEDLPYCPPGPASSDWEMVASATGSIIEEMKIGQIDDATGLLRLNATLRNFSQFQWLGTFQDLLSGDHPYAIEVREAFRGKSEDGTAAAAIGDGEVEEFREHLSMWGI